MARFSKAAINTQITVIFLLIEIVAVSFYINNSFYANTKAMNFVSEKSYLINKAMNNIDNYIALETTNKMLAEQNSMLIKKVLSMEDMLNASKANTDLLSDSSIYTSISATIVRNTINNVNNYITLNKGSKHGVAVDMSVLSGNSVVGSVVSVSPNFSIVLAAISKEFKTSGMFKKDQSICLVFWDGTSPKRLSFTEASKYASIHVGDTIVTTSFSLLFPANIDIGIVETIEHANRSFISGTLKPFTNFEKIKYVSIVEHSLTKESRELESKTVVK